MAKEDAQDDGTMKFCCPIVFLKSGFIFGARKRRERSLDHSLYSTCKTFLKEQQP